MKTKNGDCYCTGSPQKERPKASKNFHFFPQICNNNPQKFTFQQLVVTTKSIFI